MARDTDGRGSAARPRGIAPRTHQSAEAGAVRCLGPQSKGQNESRAAIAAHARAFPARSASSTCAYGGQQARANLGGCRLDELPGALQNASEVAAGEIETRALRAWAFLAEAALRKAAVRPASLDWPA